MLHLRMKREALPAAGARQALAEAIERHAAVRASVAALTKAAEVATAAWRAAREVAEAAAEGPGRARREAAAHLVSVAMGETGAVPPLSIQAARAAMEDAQESVVAAAAARDETLKQLHDEEVRSANRASAIERAAREVLREDGPAPALALAKELDTLHRAVIDKALALRWLLEQGVVVALPEIGEIDNRLDLHPVGWAIAQGRDNSPAREQWQAAFGELKADPAAALPAA